MFANAIKANPEGMEWLKARAAQLTSEGGKGKRTLQSDETLWGGRPQKTDVVHKRFKEDPAFGDAESGVRYVSWADYDWTQGEPGKLKFLEGIAKQNKVVMQEYQRLRAEGDTEEAETWLQQKYIDDAEAVYSVQMQLKGNKKTGAGTDKSQQLVDDITKDKPAPEQAPEDPNWFLADRITSEQSGRMTKEQRDQRSSHLMAKRQGEQAQNASNQTKAQEAFNAGAYKSLTGAERQQWLKDNLRHLTSDQRKVVLGNQ